MYLEQRRKQIRLYIGSFLSEFHFNLQHLPDRSSGAIVLNLLYLVIVISYAHHEMFPSLFRCIILRNTF